MALELRDLLRPLRRWWWLLILLPLVAGGTAYAMSERQEERYATSALLVVSPYQSTGMADYNTIQSSRVLAETYKTLVTTSTVLQPVIDQLALPYTVDELADNVSAEVVRDTQLIEISVSDTDPKRAAETANAIGDEISRAVAGQATGVLTSSRGALDAQIADTQAQIDAISARIDELTNGPDAADPAVQAEIASLRATLGTLQQTANDLVLEANEMDRNTEAAKATVSLFAPARVPDSPYSPRVFFYALLGVFAGLLLAGATIALLEYLDTSVGVETDYAALAGAPLLATIGRTSRKRAADAFFVLDQPDSEASKAVRLLRAGLDHAAGAKDVRTICLTSARFGEGKSTLTANLGAAFAQAGFATLIVDADLRRPSFHQRFGTPNDRGLTTLLNGDEQPWTSLVVPAGVANLSLLPSGPVPANPMAFVVSPRRLRRLFGELGAAYDVVLIDASPVLEVTDGLVTAASCDGVVLVAQAKRTQSEELRRAAAALHRGGVQLLGVVLNRQPGRHTATLFDGGAQPTLHPFYPNHPAHPAPTNGTVPHRDRPASWPHVEPVRVGPES
jgi:capsular exopolysaccharide synthesis family protein